MFAGLYSVMDSFWKQSSPCRRRRQELGVNNPPLDKEDFDLEEGRFLLNDRLYSNLKIAMFVSKLFKIAFNIPRESELLQTCPN